MKKDSRATFSEGPPNPELLSIPEAAVFLGTHPNTIRNLITSGTLPALRLGSRIIRISKSDLLRSLTPYKGGEFGDVVRVDKAD